MKKFLLLVLLVVGSACGGDSDTRTVVGYEIKPGADLSNTSLNGRNLAGLNMTEANLSHANLSHADLAGANLSYADLTGANLYGADLTGADLRGAVLTDTSLIYANLADANLGGTNWEAADIRGAYLYSAGVPESFLEFWREIEIPNIWKNDNLRAITIEESNGWTSYFTPVRSVIFGLFLLWLLMCSVVLLRQMSTRIDRLLKSFGTRFEPVVTRLWPSGRYRRYWKQVLVQAFRKDLAEVWLGDARMPKAFLWDSNMEEAQLVRANLTGALLHGANLTRASLQNADMTKADLKHTNLTGADLRGADLTGADLSSGVFDDVKWPAGWKLVCDE
jgi:uncharacterized protein YjbI with pentapeptide repeats